MNVRPKKDFAIRIKDDRDNYAEIDFAITQKWSAKKHGDKYEINNGFVKLYVPSGGFLDRFKVVK